MGDVADRRPHHWMAFFDEGSTGRPFDEADYVDREWAPPDLTRILEYMRAAPVAVATSVGGGPAPAAART